MYQLVASSESQALCEALGDYLWNDSLSVLILSIPENWLLLTMANDPKPGHFPTLSLYLISLHL